MSAPELCGCFLVCEACDGDGRFYITLPDEERSVSHPCLVCAGNGIVACIEPAVDQRPTGQAVCAAHLRWTVP